MLGKEHYIEKDVDLALGFGELYRVDNNQIGLPQVIREYKLTSEEETEELLFLVQLNQKITHPNLVKIYAYSFEDLQQKENKEDKVIVHDEQTKFLLMRAQQLEEIQDIQQKILEQLVVDPSQIDQIDDPNDPYFSSLKLVLSNQQNYKSQGLFTKQREQEQLNVITEAIQKNMELRRERQIRYIIKVAIEDVPCTLATEILKRKEEEMAFRVIDVVNFLKDSVNLFASFQFHNQEMRDIYPQNIFISYGRINSTQRFLFGISQEHLKLYKKRGSSYNQRFSKLFSRAVGFLAPELKASYFQNCFCNSKSEYSPSRCNVFSLGLVALSMATLEDTWGLNFANDKFIELKIQKLIKKVGVVHSNFLARLLEAMLEFDFKKRMDFIELDNSSIFQEMLNEKHECLEWSITFDDLKQINILKERKNDYNKYCRSLEQYESGANETINGITDFLSYKLACLSSIKIIMSPLSISLLKLISCHKIIKLQLNNINEFDSDYLEVILKQFTQLHTLQLIKCKLTTKMMLLFTRFQPPETLKVLDLSSNQYIGDIGFSTLLKVKFPSLRKLRLGGVSAGCSITLESLRNIFKLAGNIYQPPQDHFFFKLKEFDLSWNLIDAQGITYICMHYSLFKHLKQLNLSNCQFVPQNLDDIINVSQKQKISKNIKLY